ncbi:Zinc finger, CCHC-type, partial [Parasponia andersonii]
MTIEQLLGSLQAHEEKKKKKPNFKEQLLKTQFTEKENSQCSERGQHGRGRGQARGQGYGTSRGRGRGWNSNNHNYHINNFERRESSTRGRDKGRMNSRHEKSQVECFNCHKFGHYA